jgi:hypothetical protein
MAETHLQNHTLKTDSRKFLWMLLASAGIARIILAAHELPNGFSMMPTYAPLRRKSDKGAWDWFSIPANG